MPMRYNIMTGDITGDAGELASFMVAFNAGSKPAPVAAAGKPGRKRKRNTRNMLLQWRLKPCPFGCGLQCRGNTGLAAHIRGCKFAEQRKASDEALAAQE